MKDTVVSEANPQPYHKPSQVIIGQPPIGIDIGGTKINAALVKPHPTTGKDELLSMLNSPTPTDSETFLNTLVDMIQRLHAEHNVSAVGIATAGVVDSIHGRILGSTGNMPALKGIANLKELLEARTGLSVHIENDANAAAYGEWRSGGAKGAENMFAITLGTGVGMGIVFDGKMYRGSHFYAAEGGHIAIAHKRERKCTCGRWDCWEAFASGNGLQTTAELTIAAAPETAQQEFKTQYCENGEITTYAVIAAWKDNNHIGVQIMDEWHHHIAVGLSSLINVMDPDMIVVGGGLAQFVDFDLLLERTKERSMNDTFKLVPAELGNHAGIVGAAYLAMESAK